VRNRTGLILDNDSSNSAIESDKSSCFKICQRPCNNSHPQTAHGGPDHPTAAERITTPQCFQNTPRAHQLKKTFDWVVIYFDGRGGERQCTGITSAYGPLAGKRIIRGREPECMEHYLRPAARDVRSGKIQDAFSI